MNVYCDHFYISTFLSNKNLEETICVYIFYLIFKKIKNMDILLEDDDCAVEAVTPAKKKKMKQGFLCYIINCKIYMI